MTKNGEALSSVISLIDNTCMCCVWGGGGGGERGRWKGEMQSVIMKSGHITGFFVNSYSVCTCIKNHIFDKKICLPYFLVIRGGFCFQNNPQNIDTSYKTDLDFWVWFGLAGKNTSYIRITQAFYRYLD